MFLRRRKLNGDFRQDKERQDKERQEGAAMVLFISAMLPFLFFLLTLSLDLSNYFAEKELAQRKLDEAAVQAVKFLPFRDAAKEAAVFYLKEHGLTAEGGDIEVSITKDDMVEIKKIWKQNLLFATFFEEGKQMETAVFSRARNIPFDVFIALDRSSYLAPQIKPDGTGTAWSGEYAEFFGRRKLNGSIDPALATEQCFNRSFTELKLTAIKLAENISGFSLNAIGAGVYPGSGAPLDELRPVRLSTKPAGDGLGEARFLSYRRPFGLDDFCLAAALESSEERYRLPDHNEAFEGAWKAGPALVPAVDSTNYLYNQDYAPHLSLKEALWSQAVHSEVTGFDGVLLDTRNVFIAESDPERKSLAKRSLQVLAVVSGDLPWGMTPGGLKKFSASDTSAREPISVSLGKFKETLLDNPGYSLKIFYIMAELPDVTVSAEDIAALEEYFEKESLLNGKEDSRFKIRLIRPGNAAAPGDIASAVVSNLVLDSRASILSR